MRIRTPSPTALLVTAAVLALGATACSGSSDGGGAAERPGASAGASSDDTRRRIVFTPSEPAGSADLAATAERLEERADGFELDGVEVEVRGESIEVSADGAGEAELKALGRSGDLSFRPVLAVAAGTRSPAAAASSGDPRLDALDCAAADSDTLDAPVTEPVRACSSEDGSTYALGPAAVIGSHVSDAEAGLDESGTGTWLVTLRLNAAGSERFAELSGDLAAKQPPENQIGILLDGDVLSAPSVAQRIDGGEVQISGSFTRAEVYRLATLIEDGALPLDLTASQVTEATP